MIYSVPCSFKIPLLELLRGTMPGLASVIHFAIAYKMFFSVASSLLKCRGTCMFLSMELLKVVPDFTCNLQRIGYFHLYTALIRSLLPTPRAIAEERRNPSEEKNHYVYLMQ